MISAGLLYHINFNHLSLTFQQRKDYLEKYLEKILDSIILNSNIAICAEDLLLLRSWSKMVFRKLVFHPKLKFLLMPYSHALPHLFPSSFVENVRIGKVIISRIVPSQKIIGVGYSPELDLPDRSTLDGIWEYWKSMVLGETRIKIKGLKEEHYPPVFILQTDSPKKTIRCLLTRRKFNYREYLHGYLRARKTKRQIYEGIIHDFNKYSRPYPLILRIDLEVILFNAPFQKDNATGMLPLEKFERLQEYLAAQDIEFKHLPGSNLTQVFSLRRFSSDEVWPSTQENYKWNNHELLREVLARNLRTGRHKLLVMSAMCSDYYCQNLEDLIFQHGEGGVVRILKTRKYRDLESSARLEFIDGHRRKDRSPKDSYLLEYSDHLLAALNDGVNILTQGSKIRGENTSRFLF